MRNGLERIEIIVKVPKEQVDLNLNCRRQKIEDRRQGGGEGGEEGEGEGEGEGGKEEEEEEEEERGEGQASEDCCESH